MSNLRCCQTVWCRDGRSRNLYNRENPRSYDYGIELPGGRVTPMPGETLLPILPSFGLTWEL